MVRKKGHRSMVGVGLFCLASAAWSEMPEPAGQVEIRINAPTMVAALIQFTQQTGLQLAFPTDGAAQISAPMVAGSYTPRAALEQLLRDSGLTFKFVNSRTVSVFVEKTGPTAPAVPATPASP